MIKKEWLSKNWKFSRIVFWRKRSHVLDIEFIKHNYMRLYDLRVLFIFLIFPISWISRLFVDIILGGFIKTFEERKKGNKNER